MKQNTFMNNASHGTMMKMSYENLILGLKMKKRGYFIATIHTHPTWAYVTKGIPKVLANSDNFDVIGIYKEATRRTVSTNCEIWL